MLAQYLGCVVNAQVEIRGAFGAQTQRLSS